MKYNNEAIGAQQTLPDQQFTVEEGDDMNNFQQLGQGGDVPSEISSLDKYKFSILDQGKDYPLPEAVISIIQDGEPKPFLTLKSFSLWQGKQKSKKTTALAIAASEYIRPPQQDLQVEAKFIRSIDGKVLWADTEQGESYAARTMNLILRLAGVNNSGNLIFCDVRGYSPSERWEIIKAALDDDPDIRIVIIDGLVDLMNDFMDAAEGHLVVTEMLKLCSLYNIHVCGVLHQNKADKNARAHVGTISSQKCEIEISAEVDSKDRSQSQIDCVNSRGLPFESFLVRWSKGSLPCIVNVNDKNENPKPTKAYQHVLQIAEGVFKPLAVHTRTEAEEAIMDFLKVSESTAKRRMKELLSWKMVEKCDDLRYRRSKVLEGSTGGS